MNNLLSKLMSTYDTGEILVGTEDAFRFRVEIHQLQTDTTYIAKFFRYEFFRIQPTFPQHNGEPASEESDEVILVEDHLLNRNMTIDNTFEGCLRKVEQLIANFKDGTLT